LKLRCRLNKIFAPEEDIAIFIIVAIEDCDININGLEFYASKDEA
jgi:hypothetical protein